MLHVHFWGLLPQGLWRICQRTELEIVNYLSYPTLWLFLCTKVRNWPHGLNLWSDAEQYCDRDMSRKDFWVWRQKWTSGRWWLDLKLTVSYWYCFCCGPVLLFALLWKISAEKCSKVAVLIMIFTSKIVNVNYFELFTVAPLLIKFIHEYILLLETVVHM